MGKVVSLNAPWSHHAGTPEVDYDAINVLENPAIRQGIKDYRYESLLASAGILECSWSDSCSDWPTIPQLYVNGEFVGGCDIVTSLYESGELKGILEGEEANE